MYAMSSDLKFQVCTIYIQVYINVLFYSHCVFISVYTERNMTVNISVSLLFLIVQGRRAGSIKEKRTIPHHEEVCSRVCC